MIGSIHCSVKSKNPQYTPANRSNPQHIASRLEQGDKSDILSNALYSEFSKLEIQIEQTETKIVKTENIMEKLSAANGTRVESKFVVFIKPDIEHLKEHTNMALNGLAQELKDKEQECDALQQNCEALIQELKTQIQYNEILKQALQSKKHALLFQEFEKSEKKYNTIMEKLNEIMENYNTIIKMSTELEDEKRILIQSENTLQKNFDVENERSDIENQYSSTAKDAIRNYNAITIALKLEAITKNKAILDKKFQILNNNYDYFKKEQRVELEKCERLKQEIESLRTCSKD